ncbi:MAG: hypothetical protein LBL63_02390 [Clostridiales Family XIII bacterium]|jgi:hypothetical protein|nr:hypothetical protein [Clostridiales Family XIII bacterium]
MDESNTYQNEEGTRGIRPPEGDAYRPPVSDAKTADIERLEKRTKLILILLICTLVLSAAAVALQFIRPMTGRNMLGGGDFPGGNFADGQGFTQGQNG